MNARPFTPIRTERLVIRALRLDDAQALAERRSDAKVAEFQSWTVPFSLERARSIVESVVAMDGPTAGEWWMVLITDADTGDTFGDVAIHVGAEGRSAEVGYTLAAEHWGRGYLTEAMEAVVEYLFGGLGFVRVSATLHPDNVASARALERCGFVYEGRTRSSYWVDDDVSDDLLYGMVREDWTAWKTRATSSPAAVRLVEVTSANARDVRNLRTHKSQDRFVAPVIHSFADALFPDLVDGVPVVPWLRAIEADGELVGFVMVALSTDHHPEPYLWRFSIDRTHQRRGIGSVALGILEDELRAMGDGTLLVSWVEGRGSPGPFYLARGFTATGRIVEGETEARKQLG